MKIIRFLDHGGKIRFGYNYKEGTANLLSNDPLDNGCQTERNAEVKKLLAPIIPRAILGIGLNYKAHAREVDLPYPKWPILFMKNPASLSNPGDPIVIPACSTGPEVDYECELAVIIGKNAKNVKKENALEHVFGYTVANDVSARRWQKYAGAGQWDRGKSFDTFCPLGPCLVTANEIHDSQDLSLSTTLNGEIMQSSNTQDMIFSVAEIISELSKDMTLLKGSVILTGTPSGVGVGRDPKVFLKAGDEVTCSIENIGELTNPVIDAA